MNSWFLVFPAILIVWIVYWVVAVATSDSWSTRGQFGDMFGALNALFSGFAFAGVIIAIWLQRQELALTRKELGRAANAQENQIIALRSTAELNARAALLSYYSDTSESLDGFPPSQRNSEDSLFQANMLEASLGDPIEIEIEDLPHPFDIGMEKKRSARGQK